MIALVGLAAAGGAGLAFVTADIGDPAPVRPLRDAHDAPPSRPPEPEPTKRAPKQPAELADVVSPEEMKAWKYRGCDTCHGPDARGTFLGPDLTAILPLYVKKFGSADAARVPLAAYIFDPEPAPRLRQDGAEFMSPMPPITKLARGTQSDAEALAGILLRLAR